MTFLEVVTTVTERRFLAQVRALAALLGWRCYHTYRSDRSDVGFPDLVLVRPPRVIFAELKAERGTATTAQLDWLKDLRASNQEVYLWRPSDIEAVERILR